jgi:hypothetical protein
MAVVAGITAALLWLYQNPRGTLQMLPDALADATPSVVASTVVSDSGEPTALADAATALPNQVQAAVAAAAATGNVDPSSTELAAKVLVTLPPAPVVTLAPPTPTATWTPEPPLTDLEAVVALGGAQLWDADTGMLVGQASQGEVFTATAVSTDGKWLYGAIEDGSKGWASIDNLIVLNADRLPAQAVIIIPITPTPSSLANQATPAGEGTEQAGAAQANSGEMTILRPTPVPGSAPLAQVAVQDSRLNLRSGPGSSYPVIAKALPNQSFSIMARDATSTWLQLALPNIAGGFGWAAAEFLTTDGDIAALPVSDEVSNAPLYQEGQEEISQPTDQSQGQSQGMTKGGIPIPAAQTGVANNVVPSGALSGGALVNAQSPSSANPGLYGKLAIQTTWGGDIYIYDLATGDLRLLTGGFDPAISPDGKQVAFTRIGGEHGLYLINIDGSNERNIFSERTQFTSPKWSPDGQYIVFERGDEVIECTLVNPDDPASKCNPNTGPENSTEVQQKLARVDVNGNNYQDIPVLPRARVPDWNSAGIVYQSPAGIQMTQDQPSAHSKLVYFNIKKQYELDPDWQPNGGRIVFQRRENDHWDIYSVAPDGSGLTDITPPQFTLVDKLPSNVAPAWSPDGKHIVYLSNRQPNQSAGDWGVWVMNADGGNKHKLDINLDFTYTFVAEQMLDWGR